MKRAKPAPTLIGWREVVALPDLGLPLVHAKIDSGARTSALQASRVKPFEREGKAWVSFRVRHEGLKRAVDCEAPLVAQREVKNTSGKPELRPVILTTLVMGDRSWPIEVTLANRRNMSMPMIIGRTGIRNRNILVNVGKSYMLGKSRKEPA